MSKSHFISHSFYLQVIIYYLHVIRGMKESLAHQLATDTTAKCVVKAQVC